MINILGAIISAAILIAEIYFLIGLAFGIFALLEDWRWMHPLSNLDLLRDFILKWPKIIHNGMNNYFKERKERLAIKKEKIYVIAQK